MKQWPSQQVWKHNQFFFSLNLLTIRTVDSCPFYFLQRLKRLKRLKFQVVSQKAMITVSHPPNFLQIDSPLF